MRCLIYYEPVGRTREEKRLGYRVDGLRYIVGDGFACNSIYFAKEEMRDMAKHLRRQGWKIKGSMRQGYYKAFRRNKHRILYIEPVE